MKRAHQGLRFFVALSAAFWLAGCAGATKATSGAWPMFKVNAKRQGQWRGDSPQLPLQVQWRYAPTGVTNGFLDWGPVASSRMVYTPNGLNCVVALDAATGAVRWEQTLDGNVFNVALAESQGLLLATTTITARPAPTLYALDAATGTVRWHNMAQEQPAIGGIEGAVALSRDVVYAGWLRYEGAGGVGAYRVRDGQRLWQWAVPGHSAMTPVTVAGSRVLVGTDDRRLHCLDARTGVAQWQSAPLLDTLQAAPVVAGDLVVVAAGPQVQAYALANGSLVWQQAVPGAVGASSPAVFEGLLLVGTQQSQVFALDAATGRLRWETTLEEGPIESSLAVDAASGLAFIGTGHNRVVALEARTGVVRERVTLGQSDAGVWHSSPALHGGSVYIGSLDKTFYALRSAD